jgi:uncharacterized membrane protein/predicted membrane protein
MTFIQPAWFIILIPIFWFILFFKPYSRLIFILRIIITVFIIAALAKPFLFLKSSKGLLVILADRSASMPQESKEKQKEIISIIDKNKPNNAKYAVISFALDNIIEKNPSQKYFKGFSAQINPDQSNIAEALDAAFSLIPINSSGRILLLSDGAYTGKNPLLVSDSLASRNIPVDYRVIRRSVSNDISIKKISAPKTVSIKQNFRITTWINAPARTSINFSVTRQNHLLYEKNIILKPGVNKITFLDIAQKQGIAKYKIHIQSKDFKDSIPENNFAQVIVQTSGQLPILHITNNDKSNFSDMLKKAGLNVHSVKMDNQMFSVTDLTAFSSVILENVSADEIGLYSMNNIAKWVTETGAGMMMTGGKNSYAIGGFFNSPLDDILPLSMELKQEHRKFNIAIVTALDRSGSMGIQTPSGKTKMDLANISTAQVYSLLAPTDEFGVIAVDSSPHTIIPIDKIKNTKYYAKNKILKMSSMGGGIFIYEALFAAVKMVSEASTDTKHIILFADAADSENPSDFRVLLKKATDAGITVSVIGLGTPNDCDAELLKEIAELGKGECYFTENAEELPRLFAQDTFIVARNTFIAETVKANFTSDLSMITSKNFTSSFNVGGYNLCYLKPGSNIVAISDDEYHAPITAFRHSGSGRVLCYTPEVDGKYTSPALSWKYYSEYLASLVAWIASAKKSLPENMVVTQHLEKNLNIIELHLDPDRKNLLLAESPFIKTISESNNSKISNFTTPMQWKNADTLYAEIPLNSDAVNISTVFVPNVGAETLPATSLIYSPEFNLNIINGKNTLENIALATNGKYRDDLASVWNDMPVKQQQIPIDTFLIIIALVLFFFEILERRMSILSNFFALFKIKYFSHLKFNKKKISKQSKSLKSNLSNPTQNHSKKTDIKHKDDKNEKIEDQDSVDTNTNLSDALKKAKELAKK